MQSRIVGFDLARALAMLIMVLVNFKVALLAGAPAPHSDWLDLLDGRSAAIFVTLAGIGLSLLSQSLLKKSLRNPSRMHQRDSASGHSPAQSQIRWQVLRRAGFLAAIGLLFINIWPADILHYYGAMMALSSLVLFWPARGLLSLAALVLVAFPAALLLGVDYNAGWDWSSLTYPELWHWQGFWRNLWVNGFHPLLPWWSFMLLGLWLGRLDWQQAKVRYWLLFAGLLSVSLSEWLATFCTAPPLGFKQYCELVGTTSPMPPLPLYMLSAMGSTLICLVLTVTIGERFAEQRWLKELEHLGRLALTLYISHIVIGLGTVEALGLFATPSVAVATISAAIYLLLFCGFSIWHRQHFQIGPLEWCLRKAAGSAR